MLTRAKYYANLRLGKSMFLCSIHLTKVARRIDDEGRIMLKRGVRSVGLLNPYTPKKCIECQRVTNGDCHD